ncbi:MULTISPECIES: hypothetical protein [unclassified Pseudomonas]|uniref:hypothetical protein n=1 Tax=unclassified Pseudomonas TaxID=196821 RepID=UPI002B23177C|nr:MULTISPECIES: hypothetical protein [unclassified Pseudomonas]MEA9980034.1 hypothetical protein [Pseudomonas sp. RTS4]MEB0198124.1 hypothetical protein [Pseudomonas sp. 5S4]MEB0247887.1 hypothetical protein [Pseudomonas sp. 10S5]
MTLDEAMDEETMVTRVNAERECRKHSLDPSELFVELGDHTEYKTRDVLRWLGY